MNYIFVGGVPRSGTTLVQKILNNHPLIKGGSEFHHLPDIVDLRNKMMISVDRGYLKEYLGKKELDNQIVQLVNGFLATREIPDNIRYFSEKTPQNFFVFKELLNIFPKAKFILVVRDPRGTIASLKGVKQRYEKACDRQTPSWLKSVKTSAKYINTSLQESLPVYEQNKDRIFLLRYEDLIHTPEAATQKICEFLQIAWDPVMLNLAKESINDPIVDGIWYTEKMYQRSKIDSSSLYKYQKVLSKKELNTVTAFFSDSQLLKNYGYQLDTSLGYWKKAIHSIKNKIHQLAKRIITTLRLKKLALRMIDMIISN